ncbi:MAG: universal stress protein [Tatlockia sp.]|nr:universal stress protein [Tatlockia sp.]
MYSTILHATDLSANHYNLCKQASAIAQNFNAEFHLIHVIELPPSLQLAQGLGFAEVSAPFKEGAVAAMKYLGEALNIPLENQHIVVGSVKAHILDMVETLGVELMIIGSHTPNALSAFLGSTANAIVNHAKCDVLTLKEV